MCRLFIKGRASWSGRHTVSTDSRIDVGVTQVGERIWLVTFMQYDLGYFDDETCRLEPIENPFGPKLLPLRSE